MRIAIALTENIRTVSPSTISLARTRVARRDEALQGILIFTGISFALAALAVAFNALNLPSAFLL